MVEAAEAQAKPAEKPMHARHSDEILELIRQCEEVDLTAHKQVALIGINSHSRGGAALAIQRRRAELSIAIRDACARHREEANRPVAEIIADPAAPEFAQKTDAEILEDVKAGAVSMGAAVDGTAPLA